MAGQCIDVDNEALVLWMVLVLLLIDRLAQESYIAIVATGL